MTEGLLDTKAAASYLGFRTETLHSYRRFGTGPRYSKLGRSVRYRREDIDEWVAQHLVDPEAER